MGYRPGTRKLEAAGSVDSRGLQVASLGSQKHRLEGERYRESQIVAVRRRRRRADVDTTLAVLNIPGTPTTWNVHVEELSVNRYSRWRLAS